MPAGVCGKTVECANLQDLLTFQLKGLSAWAHFAHQRGVATPEVDSLVKAAVFATLTNVNFDVERMRDYCLRVDGLTRGLKAQLAAAGVADGPVPEPLPWFDAHHPVDFSLRAALGSDAPPLAALEAFAPQVSHLHRRQLMGPDAATLLGLHELLAYGLRGVAAYAHHAEVSPTDGAAFKCLCLLAGRPVSTFSVALPAPFNQPTISETNPPTSLNQHQMLGQVDASLDDVFEEVLAFLASPASADPSAVLAKAMRLGETNFKVMALLDKGHTTRFGHPEPSPVRLTPVVGKAILISGHDMQVGGRRAGRGFAFPHRCVLLPPATTVMSTSPSIFVSFEFHDRTSTTCWSRPRAPASTFTPTERCCRRTGWVGCGLIERARVLVVGMIERPPRCLPATLLSS